MKSITLEKMVLVDSENNLCYCDKEFYTTCAVRIARELPCAESILRVTPVDRDNSEEFVNNVSFAIVKALDSSLSNISSSLEGALNHFDRMRK